MKKTVSGWLVGIALATTSGLVATACASNHSGQLSQGSRATPDPIAIGKPDAQRIFCAELHTFEQDTRQAADGGVLENDIETLDLDAQSTPWTGAMQDAINQFQSGHTAKGYQVLATLDPDCPQSGGLPTNDSQRS
jgi:hypothetical protein